MTFKKAKLISTTDFWQDFQASVTNSKFSRKDSDLNPKDCPYHSSSLNSLLNTSEPLSWFYSPVTYSEIATWSSLITWLICLSSVTVQDLLDHRGGDCWGCTRQNLNMRMLLWVSTIHSSGISCQMALCAAPWVYLKTTCFANKTVLPCSR